MLKMNRQIRHVFVYQLLALLIAAWFFRDNLNTDGVAYVQLAKHYARGDFALAVSGHWSPLISWLIAVLLKTGLSPLAAARGFMIFSAIFFLSGSLQLFRSLALPGPTTILGGVVMAVLSIPWSVENITPDLLLAGLVAWAVALMLTPKALEKPQYSICAGVIWEIAFLCKAIALPLGLLTIVGISVWWLGQITPRKQIVSAMLWSISGIALISAPWVTVMTLHYGRFTVANSAGDCHSLVGPTVSQRVLLLDRGIQPPPAGRLTIWEDPENPFPDWSPLASSTNALHQAKVILKNIPIVILMLTSVSLLFPFLLGWMAWRLQDKKFWEQKHLPLLLPVLFLGALYLPNYVMLTEERYFYAAAPLLFAAAAQLNNWRSFGLVIIAAAFIAPNAFRAGIHLNNSRKACQSAHALAEKISKKQLGGPVVGSGKVSGGRLGLYLAWWLQEPWLGDEPQPNAADYKHSGAQLLVAVRNSEIARELTADPETSNLDVELFPTAADAKNFPIQIFQVRK